MKTKLFIALFMISGIMFAQKKNKKQNTKQNVRNMKIDDIKGESNDRASKRVTPYMKIDDIKGESTNKTSARYYQKRKYNEELLETNARRRGDVIMKDISVNNSTSKRTIKIGGAEKPYARLKAEPRQNSNRFWVNKKMKESDLTKSNNQRTKGETTLGDINIMKNKNTTRRRVEVAKSNKQGDPNK